MHTFSRILFATDYSETARAAGRIAAELARRFNARLHVLHVESPVARPDRADGLDVAVAVLGPGLDVVTALLPGRAAPEIAAYAARHAIDLIVIGAHGRTRDARTLLGSVAATVVRRARCPVLTVPAMIADRSGIEPAPSDVRAIERVVAIGSSLDGFEAIATILKTLPNDFPGAVVIVQHRAPYGPAVLADLLRSRTSLIVKDATDGEPLRPGVVYLAPADRHLVTEDGRLRLTDAPPVNFARPSVDVLLESVAKTYGKQAIAVILSGGGTDGARGLQAVRTAGGRTIVQNPAEARLSGMPRAALRFDGIDEVLDLDKIGPRVVELLQKG